MTLTAGSIAFVGFNADGNDGFAFIAVDPIPAGAVIRFQDNEWNGLNIGSGGAFNTGEGSFTWTNGASDLAPGTIVEFLNTSLASRSATVGTISGGTIALGASGESIFAFVGPSETSPTTFLAAITNNNGGFNGATTSGLLGGTGLTVGSTALVLPGTGGADVAAYNPAIGGSTFATREAALTAFNTTANWVAQDATGNQDADDIAPDAPFLTDPQSPIAGVTFTIGSTTPIVTITALDATAAEAGQDPGTFRISRTGATTSALTVNYTIATGAGQATNGVDYTPTLTGSVEIPVGQSFVDITITPVDDSAVEGAETVTLTLVDATDYDLGTDTTATITITDNDVAMGNIQITEYMYDGANGEFVEFTNVGNAPVNMTGWSFDDNSRVPGSFDLSGFGVVQPGESVILTEASAAAFRAAWSLPNSVKVIGGLGGSNNLGRTDEINLYDNNGMLVDRLTYGDQTFPGTIRTQTRSGWAPVDQLADQTIDTDWVLSTVNDAQNSRTSTGGDIGNPGHFNAGAPGVLLIESGASTNVTEGGATDTYTLVLRSQPTANVVITLNSGSQLTTSATTVTFTPGNWNVAQTVTVTAVDDTTVEGTHPGTIT
ncbi:MAG: lamin tail domain-containing protein, partial [Cyanobacteria bacterium]|nr:lamin tail domain-containing protein [Cyanobacteriota bacterium]MDW8202288.1 lamin tail domain-containing protein [Cyanobacteriota bacterium SKYGB_h_bin112]